METLHTLQEPGFAEVLHALDDETLRRILKVGQPLTANDHQTAVEQSPSIKGGNIRRYERETVADRSSRMTEGQRGDERVEPSFVNDRSRYETRSAADMPLQMKGGRAFDADVSVTATAMATNDPATDLESGSAERMQSHLRESHPEGNP